MLSSAEIFFSSFCDCIFMSFFFFLLTVPPSWHDHASLGRLRDSRAHITHQSYQSAILCPQWSQDPKITRDPKDLITAVDERKIMPPGIRKVFSHQDIYSAFIMSTHGV